MSDFVTQRQLPPWPYPTIVEILAIGVIGAWIYASNDSALAFGAPFMSGNISKVILTKSVQILSNISFAIYMMHGIILLFVFNLLQKFQIFSGHIIFVKIPNPLAKILGEPTTIQILQMNNLGICLAFIIYIFIVVCFAYCGSLWVERPGRAYFNEFAKRLTAWLLVRQDSGPAAATTPPPQSNIKNFDGTV